MSIINDIKKLDIGKVINNYNLSEHTTYKVGGNAICAVVPDDVDGLIELLYYLRENNVKYKILGNGSNVIFNNSGYDGVIIKMDNFSNLKIIGNTITVGAGYPLNKLAIRLSRLGFTGMEFAAGIPGSVGGAVYMNAGAYKSDIGYILTSAKVITPEYKIKTMDNKDLNFHYRSSFLQDNKDYVCIEATFSLIKGNADEIMEIINTRKERRLETQPLEYPSAGSVFRNPEGDFAGRLIEDSGLKGKKHGGAMISDKHANFVINYDKASAEDIKYLIDLAHDTVLKNYNVDMKIEQEFVNWE